MSYCPICGQVAGDNACGGTPTYFVSCGGQWWYGHICPNVNPTGVVIHTTTAFPTGEPGNIAPPQPLDNGAALSALLEERDSLKAQVEQCQRYATQLCESMAAGFPAVPEWKPLDDLFGLLMQIDNMWVGFKERLEERDYLKAQVEQLQNAVQCLNGLLKNETARADRALEIQAEQQQEIEALRQDKDKARNAIIAAVKYVIQLTGTVEHDKGRLALVFLSEQLEAIRAALEGKS